MPSVPVSEAPKIILSRDGKPPQLEGKQAVTGYCLMLLQQAINARAAVPKYDEATIGADKAIFSKYHAIKDTFWLRYGCAAGAIDVAMACKQLDDGVYEKLRMKLNEVLLSAVDIRL